MFNKKDEEEIDPTQLYVPEDSPADLKKKEALQGYFEDVWTKEAADKNKPKPAGSFADQWKEKSVGFDSDIADKKKAADYAGYADIAGNLLTNYSNSQKQAVILPNRLEDLGKKNDRIEPEMQKWNSVQPAFDRQVANAKDAKESSFKELGRSMSLQQADRQLADDELSRGDKALDRGDKADARAIAKAANDPNSPQSKRAQVLANTILSARISEAQQAGDPDTVAKLKAFDVSSLTLSDSKELIDGMKSLDWKDKLSNQAADKRMKMQLDAQVKSDANKASNTNREITFKLAERYNADPITKATAEVRTAAEKASALVKNPTPSNDTALIYNFMKANDPGSTVRESEFASATNRDSLPAKVQSYLSMVESGQLTPAKRAEIVNAIRTQANAQEVRQSQIDSYYNDQAVQYNANPDVIIGKKRAAPVAAPQEEETKTVNGVLYRKVDGGWEEK